jgi:ABC-type multidrug transport system fused ATPase/permease subunit
MQIGLKTLRQLVGLVPQDPVLISGSVRINLDPFDEHSDDRIWQALDKVRLGSHLLNLAFPTLKKGSTDLDKGREQVQMRATLGMSVQPQGENFSFGQRQLLCIARILLRQPAVLLLDECTSSVDPRTQEILQETLRTGFPRSTTIAIAHRLASIMDYDKVIVFDRGNVKKVGCPKNFEEVDDLLAWATDRDTPKGKWDKMSEASSATPRSEIMSSRSEMISQRSQLQENAPSREAVSPTLTPEQTSV